MPTNRNTSVPTNLDAVFFALAHPIRRELVGELAQSRQPLSISDFAAPRGISLQMMGKHMRILERAKLVRRHKVGTENYLSLNSHTLADSEQWLAAHRTFWQHQFASLEHYLKQLTEEHARKK